MDENPQLTSDAAHAIGSGERIDRLEGLVKWFDPRKGYGFIVGPQGQDIFVHYLVIEGEGFRALKDGSTVVYDALKTDKGWKATKVLRGVESTEVQVVAKKPHLRSPRR